MIAAMFLPTRADEITLADALQLATDRGLALCVPKNFSPLREFSAVCFPADRIPAGWRRAAVGVKGIDHTETELPCLA